MKKKNPKKNEDKKNLISQNQKLLIINSMKMNQTKIQIWNYILEMTLKLIKKQKMF